VAGPRRGTGLAVVAAVLGLFALNVRLGASLAPLEPSSHYRSAVAALDRWYGTRTAVGDCVELRAREGARSPAALRIELRGGYRFRGNDAGSTLWQPPRRQKVRLRVLGERPPGPLALALTPQRPGAGTVTVRPIDPAAWMRWSRSGIRGVEVRWCGGGRG
jgi:hypothetical protein